MGVSPPRIGWMCNAANELANLVLTRGTNDLKIADVRLAAEDEAAVTWEKRTYWTARPQTTKIDRKDRL
jgi:hypothetical protein